MKTSYNFNDKKSQHENYKTKQVFYSSKQTISNLEKKLKSTNFLSKDKENLYKKGAKKDNNILTEKNSNKLSLIDDLLNDDSPKIILRIVQGFHFILPQNSSYLQIFLFLLNKTVKTRKAQSNTSPIFNEVHPKLAFPFSYNTRK